MTTFVSSFPALDKADLDLVESRFGFKFPHEFRELYLRSNGGRPEKNRFLGEKGTYVVNTFLPIKYGKRPFTRLEDSIHRMHVESNLLPGYLMQFAIDSFGNYFCFSVRDQDYGSIYFWDMDCQDTSREPDYLSSSFDDFLMKLTAKNKARESEEKGQGSDGGT